MRTELTMDVLKSWNGLEPGDIFTVEKTRGNFEFIHAEEEGGVVTGIRAFGGRKGYEKMRTLWPNKVIIPDAKELQKQRKTKETKDKKNASNA